MLPELRKDPITGRWVIISTDPGQSVPWISYARAFQIKRQAGYVSLSVPTQTKRKTPSESSGLRARVQGGKNMPGWSVRVVPNKFPALGN